MAAIIHKMTLILPIVPVKRIGEILTLQIQTVLFVFGDGRLLKKYISQSGYNNKQMDLLSMQDHTVYTWKQSGGQKWANE